MTEQENVASRRKAKVSRKPRPTEDEDAEILAHLPPWARRFRELRREAEVDGSTPSDGSR
jgi:hypothetical protein